VPSLIEEAFERCGVELRTGYDIKTARRSMNLLSIEWANRGLNLWTIEQGEIPLVSGQAEYDLPLDTVDLMDSVIRTGANTGQADVSIMRISATTYAQIPSKNVPGRPVQVWVDRQIQPTVTFWPIPDQTGYYTFKYWRLRRIQDTGTGATTADIPFRFLPALVAGLSFYLAMKIPDALGRLEMLKMAYDEQWNLAADEDREKASLVIAPRMRR